jgi:hypothetical protein
MIPGFLKGKARRNQYLLLPTIITYFFYPSPVKLSKTKIVESDLLNPNLFMKLLTSMWVGLYFGFEVGIKCNIGGKMRF